FTGRTAGGRRSADLPDCNARYGLRLDQRTSVGSCHTRAYELRSRRPCLICRREVCQNSTSSFPPGTTCSHLRPITEMKRSLFEIYWLEQVRPLRLRYLSSVLVEEIMRPT